MKRQWFIYLICLLSLLFGSRFIIELSIPGNTYALDQTFYVAPNGDDVSGDGSALKPWGTITKALDSVSDGATILARPGTYPGRVRLRGTFDAGVTVRSEVPYQARLRHNATVVTCFYGKFSLMISPAAKGSTAMIRAVISSSKTATAMTTRTWEAGSLRCGATFFSTGKDLPDPINQLQRRCTYSGKIPDRVALRSILAPMNTVADLIYTGCLFFSILNR